jgi:hypothetical protein
VVPKISLLAIVSTQASTAQDRIELWSTLMLTLASVLTAWSVYQSAAWAGREAVALGEAAARRIESMKAAEHSAELRIIDMQLFLQWAQATAQEQTPAELRAHGYVANPNTLSGFLAGRFRPEFRPAFEAWLAARPLVHPGAPSTPFVMKEYALASTAEADRLSHEAEASFALGRSSMGHSVRWISNTVLFSIVLFLSAVATKLERGRRLMTAAAALFLVVATALLLTLPRV